VVSSSSVDKIWNEYTFVAFDTETSGAYPVGFDVVEFGAVKWRNGQVIDRIQFLLKPREPMSDFIIGIHGITNEMVATAPLMVDKIVEIRNFFEGSVLMAHHAPFDMGFIAHEFESHLGQVPSYPVLCTSLLSRKMIPESKNHKLQTLVSLLKIDGGQAHRAEDDARACLEVGLECMKRMGDISLSEVIKAQGKDLRWSLYSLKHISAAVDHIKEAIKAKKPLSIVYDGGTVKGKPRLVTPIGIVRNPDGDYLYAKCEIDKIDKRFYLSRILDSEVSY
jgi:DNA polymerase III subunit epsilon